MEFVHHNRSIQELVSIIQDTTAELETAIENIFNETIEKMKQTDNINVRRDLFYQLLNESVKFGPFFDIQQINLSTRAETPEITAYNLQGIVKKARFTINFQTMEFLFAFNNCDLNYDNFFEILN